MKIITILIFALIMFIPGFFTYAVEKTIGDTIVETGHCDRDIMPFLETAAAKWGEHFIKIYGECNNGSISIRIDSSGKYETFNEIKKTSFSFVKELALIFPLSTAQVEVFPAEVEKSWHIIRWEVKNGEITSYQEN
ncbi:MAG: hypothetical protein M0R48_06350 [Candidatus Omnitrophica bacterium]|nr:hypothetical protein [Candidatus Omnitrophota bacterium]